MLNFKISMCEDAFNKIALSDSDFGRSVLDMDTDEAEYVITCSAREWHGFGDPTPVVIDTIKKLFG